MLARQASELLLLQPDVAVLEAGLLGAEIEGVSYGARGRLLTVMLKVLVVLLIGRVVVHLPLVVLNLIVDVEV